MNNRFDALDNRLNAIEETQRQQQIFRARVCTVLMVYH
jgi:hypothetical protein